jgi:hypothetical protein
MPENWKTLMRKRSLIYRQIKMLFFGLYVVIASVAQATAAAA